MMKSIPQWDMIAKNTLCDQIILHMLIFASYFTVISESQGI